MSFQPSLVLRRSFVGRNGFRIQTAIKAFEGGEEKK
jgi:hypothetical protein